MIKLCCSISFATLPTFFTCMKDISFCNASLMYVFFFGRYVILGTLQWSFHRPCCQQPSSLQDKILHSHWYVCGWRCAQFSWRYDVVLLHISHACTVTGETLGTAVPCNLSITMTKTTTYACTHNSCAQYQKQNSLNTQRNRAICIKSTSCHSW